MKYRKETVQFEYEFLDLVINGTYIEYEQDTRETQGSPSEFEIDKIHLFADSKQTDLYNVLEKANYIDDIKTKAIQFIEE